MFFASVIPVSEYASTWSNVIRITQYIGWLVASVPPCGKTAGSARSSAAMVAGEMTRSPQY